MTKLYGNQMYNIDILSHRKKKFLSVGRSKGFVSNNTDNLINEQNFLQKFKNKTNLTYSKIIF